MLLEITENNHVFPLFSCISAAGQCSSFSGTMSAECQGQTSSGGKEYVRIEWNLALMRTVTASSSVTDHDVMFDVLVSFAGVWARGEGDRVERLEGRGIGNGRTVREKVETGDEVMN